jgi:two-component system, sensor histidine kinase PhcS
MSMSMSLADGATTFHASYEKQVSGHQLLSSRACALTVIVLVLAGMLLDYAIYPVERAQFAFVRVATSAAVLAALGLLYTPFGQRHVHSITFVWLLFPQMMIAWMINATQGETSLFYAGIILTIFAVGTLFPVGHWYTIGFGLITATFYILACYLRPQGVLDHGQFLFHLTIILFAGAASAVYTVFAEKGRRQLFLLQEELAQKNSELASINADLLDIKGQMLQQEKMAAIGTLAAGLMHEVNNPVNFCMMAIDLALEEPAAKDSALLADCLTDAREGMARIQHIVSDLKTFAYRKKGAESEDADFLFEKALNSAIRLTGFELKGVAITRQMPTDTLVHGDEAAIVGVLINLFSNAVLAMRKAGRSDMAIAITVGWDGDRLRVAVQDNGPGISAENLARVFEPFFTTREVGQGLGLGLSISYSIIQRHGGLLMAESEPGAWTRMLFDLPRAQVEGLA